MVGIGVFSVVLMTASYRNCDYEIFLEWVKPSEKLHHFINFVKNKILFLGDLFSVTVDLFFVWQRLIYIACSRKWKVKEKRIEPERFPRKDFCD